MFWLEGCMTFNMTSKKKKSSSCFCLTLEHSIPNTHCGPTSTIFGDFSMLCNRNQLCHRRNFARTQRKNIGREQPNAAICVLTLLPRFVLQTIKNDNLLSIFDCGVVNIACRNHVPYVPIDAENFIGSCHILPGGALARFPNQAAHSTARVVKCDMGAAVAPLAAEGPLQVSPGKA